VIVTDFEPNGVFRNPVLGFFDAAAAAGPARGVADSPFQFYVPQTGNYPFRVLYYQTSGGASPNSVVVAPNLV
jgi:hypothetical protein